MAVQPPVKFDELSNYILPGIEHPRVELKEFWDITDKLNQVKTAKHIAALANYGGGWIVFGVEEGKGPKPDKDNFIENFTPDNISAIARKYLTPAPLVNVRTKSFGSPSVDCIVIQVISHGEVPVCSKRDGPQDKKGKIQGIKTGTYYSRTTQPESLPVSAPEDWDPIITRCVTAKREVLVSAFSGILDSTSTTEADDFLNRLSEWSRIEWLEALPTDRTWSVDLSRNFRLLSFRFVDSEGETLSAISTEEYDHALLNSRNITTQETNDGYALPFPDPLGEKYVRLFESSEVVTRELVTSGGDFSNCPKLWGVSARGFGYSIRAYDEDTKNLAQDDGWIRWDYGSVFSPRWQSANLFKALRNLYHLSSAWNEAAQVEVSLLYNGLRGRELKNPSGSFSYSRYAREDGRESTLFIPLTKLNSVSSTSDVAAELINSTLRLFDRYELVGSRILAYFN